MSSSIREAEARRAVGASNIGGREAVPKAYLIKKLSISG
jgi:hypothetical protein